MIRFKLEGTKDNGYSATRISAAKKFQWRDTSQGTEFAFACVLWAAVQFGGEGEVDFTELR